MKHQLIIKCSDRAKELEGQAHSGAFQILQFISGHGITVNSRGLHLLSPGDLCFTRPDEMRFWSFADNAIVNYCGIWPEYLVKTPHISKLLWQHPAFTGQKKFASMSAQQSSLISMVFRVISNEAESSFENKKEAILLHLQLMMLYLRRFSTRSDTLLRERPPDLREDLQLLVKPLFDDANLWIQN
ncbi:hypothetical protein LXM25_16630 [Dyadobacter sp. LJ53]|uniref:hypothetical protein n=1 Tax=Dyadobacter chenwenxiniae TaxID=2906456 RepID=UPI001F48CF7C|nr:hypothetical protein [Dyadobacter chenwenxiniae]MCF0051697.1 hypothetical protein [Dyadobacter chenwenxiniae]